MRRKDEDYYKYAFAKRATFSKISSKKTIIKSDSIGDDDNLGNADL